MLPSTNNSEQGFPLAPLLPPLQPPLFRSRRGTRRAAFAPTEEEAAPRSERSSRAASSKKDSRESSLPFDAEQKKDDDDAEAKQSIEAANDDDDDARGNGFIFKLFDAMAAVSVTSVRVLDNPAPFTNPLQFEIQYECLYPLKHGASVVICQVFFDLGILILAPVEKNKERLLLLFRNRP